MNTNFLASLPLLVGILFAYNCLCSLCLFLLCCNDFLSSSLFYVCIIFAFLVRMPMFIVHLWLPRAQVGAPVSGSIILAGVLLKLGVRYVLIRVFPVLFSLNQALFIDSKSCRPHQRRERQALSPSV